jgi:hypothetical protein
MYQDELEFCYCEVNDEPCRDLRQTIFQYCHCFGNVSADDLASVSVKNRSRAVIGGVLSGMCKASELKIVGRVPSKIKANHGRYINLYEIAK